MKSHKDLIVWQKSIDLVEEIYLFTKQFPKEEIYGLTSQIRRSAVSISSYIAEGAARQTSKEFIQFLYIALGSTSELETQMIIANKLHYIKNVDVIKDIEEIGKMLKGLITSVKKKI